MELPLDCQAIYEEQFLTEVESSRIYQHLIHHYQVNQAFLKMNVPGMNFKSDFAKISFTDAANIESNSFPENAYGKTHVWDPIMVDIKSKIETYADAEFGMCVCIYYPDGKSGVDFAF